MYLTTEIDVYGGSGKQVQPKTHNNADASWQTGKQNAVHSHQRDLSENMEHLHS